MGNREAEKQSADARNVAPHMSRDEFVAGLSVEFKRREAAGTGCDSCPYCNLGAPELCRHYDLDLALMAFDDAASSAGAPASAKNEATA